MLLFSFRGVSSPDLGYSTKQVPNTPLIAPEKRVLFWTLTEERRNARLLI
jgi:hypothetical protein